LQNFIEASVELMFLLDDGHQDVDADRDPHLRLDGVVRGSEERLDAEVLFDPLEEKFHLPATFVKLGDRQSVEHKVVGQEDETFAGVEIDILNAPERLRIFRGCVDACKNNRLIAAESRGFVHGAAFLRAKLHVLFCARDEESHVCVEAVQSSEIDITSIHGVEGARLDGKMIERFDIVHFSIGNVDETGNVPSEIDQGMELDGRFASAESRPREESQTQIDGSRIEGVNGLI